MSNTDKTFLDSMQYNVDYTEASENTASIESDASLISWAKYGRLCIIVGCIRPLVTGDELWLAGGFPKPYGGGAWIPCSSATWGGRFYIDSQGKGLFWFQHADFYHISGCYLWTS